MEKRVEGLLNRIPGYGGYRAKEDRRDADKRVREHVAAALGQRADRIERVARDLAAQRQLQAVGPVDEFARTVRHLIDRVQTASYGYGGLFSDRDVDELALDQLRQFDESLLSGVEELDGPVGQLEAAHAANGDRAEAAQAGTAVARRLLARLDLRGQVIETAKPAAEAAVLELLQPATTAPPHPATSLTEGDALSILGDDYLVDAHVAVEAGSDSFRLVRLGASGGRGDAWLYVPADGTAMALLEATSEPYHQGPPVTIGATAFRGEAAGRGAGELVGSGGASGKRAVSYAVLRAEGDEMRWAVVIDWGNERQILVGNQTHPNDVEVYGNPAS